MLLLKQKAIMIRKCTTSRYRELTLLQVWWLGFCFYTSGPKWREFFKHIIYSADDHRVSTWYTIKINNNEHFCKVFFMLCGFRNRYLFYTHLKRKFDLNGLFPSFQDSKLSIHCTMSRSHLFMSSSSRYYNVQHLSL